MALDAEGRITLMTHGPVNCWENAGHRRRLSECGSSYLHIQSLMDDAAEKRGAVRDTLLLAGPPERILQVYAAPIIDGGPRCAGGGGGCDPHPPSWNPCAASLSPM